MESIRPASLPLQKEQYRMAKKSTLFLFILLSASLIFFGALPNQKEKKPEQDEKETEKKVDIAKVSKAFGHLIGKNLQTLGVEFNIKEIMEGIKDGLEGKLSQMDESECMQAISAVREKAFERLASENLTQANAFLTRNVKEQGVLELERDKLQYRVEKMGNGPVVEKHHSPMIRYTGKFLDGKVFGSSDEDELISLQETIPGFTKGIVGMKEGERRTIFIHPELGYGSSGYLPPNSLLIFDIEVVKANVPKPDGEESPTSEYSPENVSDEMADQTDQKKVIR